MVDFLIRERSRADLQAAHSRERMIPVYVATTGPSGLFCVERHGGQVTSEQQEALEEPGWSIADLAS